MNLNQKNEEEEQEEKKVQIKTKSSNKINFRMCSECGLPQNQQDMNGHFSRKHPDVYKEYKEMGKLNLEKGILPRNPHNEWMDKLMLRLDQYPRKSIKSDPYWEFLYQHVKHYYSCFVFWQCRNVWKLTIPEPSVRE